MIKSRYMKIAIMSDSHENWQKLSAAIEVANKQECTHLLFAGDLIAPPGIPVLAKFNGKVHFVWGNNEAERVGITRQMDASENITMEGDVFESEIHGLKIFMNHYPRITELAAQSGAFDICIHGHTHLYREETIGKTLLINPGEIQGYRTGTATFVILDCETRKVQKVEV
jgi:uncharacterized protein